MISIIDGQLSTLDAFVNACAAKRQELDHPGGIIRHYMHKDDLPRLPPGVPAFRLETLAAAPYVILQMATNDRWIDLLVRRSPDLVYVCTWLNTRD